MGTPHLDKWVEESLRRISTPSEADLMISSLKQIPNAEDREIFLVGMLDPSNPVQSAFLEEFRKKKAANGETSVRIGKAYRKGNVPGDSQQHQGGPSKQKKASSTFKKSNEGLVQNLEIKAKEPKGRLLCRCQATKHNLINNCLSCGKVVCQREGSGPCLFCGELVCTNEERDILNRGSRKSEELRKKLIGSGASSDLAKAEAQRNRLLEYDRTSESRTKVIDDESDYFSLDSMKWMTPRQKELLAAKKDEMEKNRHRSRRDNKVDFDFAGRRIVESRPNCPDFDFDDLLKSTAATGTMESRRWADDGNGNPNTNSGFRPELIAGMLDLDILKDKWSQSVRMGSGGNKIVQDRELMEMSDEGYCLSMHQPYASYLVSGIKVHEGRTWYSNHRGRLWIHAAAKQPTEDEVKEVRNFYRYTLNREVNFPSQLPTSCLLGCVNVEDVLAQEEYRERFPDGESSSPFVFVCSDPRELSVRFPMSGQHKIYKLDPKIHVAARKALKL